MYMYMYTYVNEREKEMKKLYDKRKKALLTFHYLGDYHGFSDIQNIWLFMHLIYSLAFIINTYSICICTYIIHLFISVELCMSVLYIIAT